MGIFDPLKSMAESTVKREVGKTFDNENRAMLYVKSSGADNPCGIKLRRKPSTGQWFLNDIRCLSDIKEPAEEDPWA